jgi:hypothetical protein
MSITPHDLLLPFLWLLNGLLALSYLLFGRILALLLIPFLAWLGASGPREHRPWVAAAAGLSIASATLSPQPVPVLTLVMACAGVIAVLLERFNPLILRWRAAGGLALYALMGLGFTAYQALTPIWQVDSPLLNQGQTYLSVLVSLAMWAYPLGYLALLAQSIWVHPPLSQNPETLIHTLRARGKQ